MRKETNLKKMNKSELLVMYADYFGKDARDKAIRRNLKKMDLAESIVNLMYYETMDEREQKKVRERAQRINPDELGAMERFL